MTMNVSLINGLIVLDKPSGMTSRAVVDRVLRWFPRRTRIGHTGTLDPLATGVLVLCVGEATRLSEYVQRMSKLYRTTLLLGSRSDSDDAHGNITTVSGAVPPDASEVATCVAAFVGVISQIPPAFSAAKVSGRRAYDLARQGREVALQARSVQIYAIDVLGYAYPHLELEVRCGKGAYIRSLARDIGERLGCGALVQTLRRTRVGPFRSEDALSLDADADMAAASLLPVEAAVAELQRFVLPEGELIRLRQGQSVSLGARSVSEGEHSLAYASGLDGLSAAVFDETGALAALARFDPRRQTLQPVKVFQSKKR